MPDIVLLSEDTLVTQNRHKSCSQELTYFIQGRSNNEIHKLIFIFKCYNYESTE